ncbi:LamG-like jellyroll fold domain-containing protein [Fibrobacter sp. UWB12]|uniref:LamG-like jellyroll fold domain-containing protein n=1 Tax=Fibrobacter sp. UWB12 TaxID=1896203 RepID=UPI000920D070|nr:LamG-like jellyroll fold domain-containing protein [Fibrobacter sp. UWB12]SHK43729.1 Concanavalin A-like lectin/glucanases superfamily protein [Fibrobacter sp. UWB12]
MSGKMVKWLSGSLIAMGAFVVGCSESNSSTPFAETTNDGVYMKNDVKQMWARIDERGSIASYFDSLSKEEGAPAIGVSTRSNVRCAAPALQMDDNTRYLDELETLFDEGEQVEGVCGKALKLSDGQVAPLGVNLIDSMSVGTVEFWFRPNADFFDKNARTLLGNDGARIHFFYKGGELFFQKNHHNQHYYVNGKAALKDDWNLIAGQWGDGYMSLWLNGELVGYWEHDKGYVPAQRAIPFENLVVIGYKSSCCMEGPGQYESMTTSGSFDQFRISNIARYALPDSLIAKDTTEEKKETPEVVPEKKEEERTCKASALKMDDNTLYLDELESDYESGTLVDGVCGKAVSLKDGENIQTGINLIDEMAAGTVEFWFRPSDEFDLNTARTLLGNDGARLHFFVKNGELIFQKNHPDIHYYVKGAVTLKKDWNLIAGQWGDGYMSLWVNGEMVASKVHAEGYAPSTRSYEFENLIVIGYKSWCCMEGPGQHSSMTTSGDFDQLRISNIPRYEVKVEEQKQEEKDSVKILVPIDVDTTVVKTDSIAGNDTTIVVVDSPVVDTTESK